AGGDRCGATAAACAGGGARSATTTTVGTQGIRHLRLKTPIRGSGLRRYLGGSLVAFQLGFAGARLEEFFRRGHHRLGLVGVLTTLAADRHVLAARQPL